jgi:hypothetical protein
VIGFRDDINCKINVIKDGEYELYVFNGWNSGNSGKENIQFSLNGLKNEKVAGTTDNFYV